MTHQEQCRKAIHSLIGDDYMEIPDERIWIPLMSWTYKVLATMEADCQSSMNTAEELKRLSIAQREKILKPARGFMSIMNQPLESEEGRR